MFIKVPIIKKLFQIFKNYVQNVRDKEVKSQQYVMSVRDIRLF